MLQRVYAGVMSEKQIPLDIEHRRSGDGWQWRYDGGSGWCARYEDIIPMWAKNNDRVAVRLIPWKENQEMNNQDKLAAMTDDERAKLVDEISDVAVAKLQAKSGPRQCVYVLDSQYVEGRGYVPSMVTEGEAGHSPLTGKGELSEPWYWGHDLAKAKQIAAEFNAKLGLTSADVEAIVMSSMVASFRQDTARADVDRKLGR